MALSPFGAVGNVADPDFRIVNEAKRTKEHEEDDPGDPPNEKQEDRSQEATPQAHDKHDGLPARDE
jgi:hypothetical protein